MLGTSGFRDILGQFTDILRTAFVRHIPKAQKNNYSQVVSLSMLLGSVRSKAARVMLIKLTS